jgi:hypothetical protein
MIIFKELDKLMNEFSENIAAEVSEKRMYEVAEVKAIAKTRLWFAITQCLQLQVTEAENRRRGLVQLYHDQRLPNWKRIKLQAELAEVTAEKKDANRLLHTMADYNEYEQLRHYIRDKYGYEALKDFYDNYCNKEEFKNRKGTALKPGF